MLKVMSMFADVDYDIVNTCHCFAYSSHFFGVYSAPQLWRCPGLCSRGTPAVFPETRDAILIATFSQASPPLQPMGSCMDLVFGSCMDVESLPFSRWSQSEAARISHWLFPPTSRLCGDFRLCHRLSLMSPAPMLGKFLDLLGDGWSRQRRLHCRTHHGLGHFLGCHISCS